MAKQSLPFNHYYYNNFSANNSIIGNRQHPYQFQLCSRFLTALENSNIRVRRVRFCFERRVSSLSEHISIKFNEMWTKFENKNRNKMHQIVPPQTFTHHSINYKLNVFLPRKWATLSFSQFFSSFICLFLFLGSYNFHRIHTFAFYTSNGNGNQREERKITFFQTKQ